MMEFICCDVLVFMRAGSQTLELEISGGGCSIATKRACEAERGCIQLQERERGVDRARAS